MCHGNIVTWTSQKHCWAGLFQLRWKLDFLRGNTKNNMVFLIDPSTQLETMRTQQQALIPNFGVGYGSSTD